ncbi:MAG: DNA-processing protein DprA [Patescibacteria group bacterium]
MEPLFYHLSNLVTRNDYRKLQKAKDFFGNWKNVWENIKKTEKSDLNPEVEWKKLQKLNINLVLNESLDYPVLLKEIPWPPFGIYSIGALNKINEPTLAIVGTRKATENGKELARIFASSLVLSGINIVSGLALGIDASSHAGAIEAKGYTVAVLGNGLDEIYPKTNEKLGKKILESGGAIISEYPPDMPSLPHHFIQRNRIISGLSKGILVIEAPERSGSLATARFAVDQNRDIFVIPGPISHPNFKGSNELIRQGATLVTKPEHIIEIIEPELAQKETKTQNLFAENPEEALILNALQKSKKGFSVDKIIELTKLDAEVANRVLSFLVIKNVVKETENGYTL